MEKKIMMPANYNVMSEEEMTYTQGGDATSMLLGRERAELYGETV